MKLLVLPSWYPTEQKPGNGVFFKEQAEALQKRGHQVAVLYPELHFHLRGQRTGVFPLLDGPQGFVCRRRSLTPFFEAGRAPQRRRMLAGMYARLVETFGRPDIVLLHACRLGPEAAWLCAREGLPLVYTEHYSGVLRAAQAGWPHGTGALKRELRAALAASDAAVAVSGALKSAMTAALPEGKRGGCNIQVIPNLVQAQLFRPTEAPHEGFVFAAMGNFVPVKAFDTLLRAFALVHEKEPGTRLFLAGDGELGTSLRALCAQLGLSQSVRFTGRVPREQAPRFFAGCDCFVSSSLFETFGMVLIEAMACGKPVVATRCGGPQDIIGEKDGLLCQPGDAAALADAMLRVMAGYREYDAAGIRARCLARFSADAVCERLEALYEQVLRGRLTAQ